MFLLFWTLFFFTFLNALFFLKFNRVTSCLVRTYCMCICNGPHGFYLSVSLWCYIVSRIPFCVTIFVITIVNLIANHFKKLKKKLTKLVSKTETKLLTISCLRLRYESHIYVYCQNYPSLRVSESGPTKMRKKKIFVDNDPSAKLWWW